MKRFLINASVVFVVLFGVMILLDVWITHNLHHSKANVFQGMNDVFFDSTYYDMVIMGSSRGLVQYDTRILDTVFNKNCYNLSVNGRGVISQIIKYRVYEKRHGKPKVILQNIDNFLLEEDNGFEREQYLPYLFDKELFDMIKERESLTFFDRLLPLVRYAGYEQMIKEGLGMKNKLIKTKMFNGYWPRYENWDGHMLNTIEEVGFSYNPVAVTAFKHFLSECNEKGIKVVFVYSPLYSGARCKMSDETKKVMFESFDQMAREFQIPILSWWDCSISEDTAYFYNATHLNADGAELFTKEVSHCLDSLGIMN